VVLRKNGMRNSMYDMTYSYELLFCLFDVKEFIPWPPRAHCHLAGAALVSVVAPVNQTFQRELGPSLADAVESLEMIVARIVCPTLFSNLPHWNLSVWWMWL